MNSRQDSAAEPAPFAGEMPAVFAVVQERDGGPDGWIAAWVLEFSDRAEAVSADGGLRMTASSADRVLATFARLPGAAHLIPFDLPSIDHPGPDTTART